MKKGQICEGTVQRVDFPDKAVVMAEGEAVAVKHGLPGQKLRIQITRKRGARLEGRILEVIEHAPEEIREGVCPHAGQCGGCNYQALPDSAENEIKDGQMRRLLEPVIGTGVFRGVLEPPKQREYRNKMEFSFGDEEKDGPLALGMHRRGSFYDVLTVSQCQIVDGDFRKILTAARDYFAKKKTPFYRKMQHTGYLRHLLVRKGAATGEILVDLVTTSQTEFLTDSEKINMQKANVGQATAGQASVDQINVGQTSTEQANTEQDNEGQTSAEQASIEQRDTEQRLLDGFLARLLGLALEGHLVGVLHTVNDSLADVVKSDRADCLYGRDYFYEKLLGLTFKVTAFSFFQTNSLGAEVLYETVREYIGETKNKVIYDLYSGTGTIAQILAPVARKVVGVEIVEEAVEAAKANAAQNGLNNCEFIAGDVLAVLDSLTEKPDLIVLDPPREGIHPKALPKIVGYGVDRIVYISCKPTSLVRDLEFFYGAGYQVTKACSVNMFCKSANIETVVLMSKTQN